VKQIRSLRARRLDTTKTSALCLFNIRAVGTFCSSLSNGAACKKRTYPSSMRTTSGCLSLDCCCCWVVEAARTICMEASSSRTKRLHQRLPPDSLDAPIFQPVAAQLILLGVYANAAGDTRRRTVSKKRKCFARAPHSTHTAAAAADAEPNLKNHPTSDSRGGGTKTPACF
jgi:hypothetical protein